MNFKLWLEKEEPLPRIVSYNSNYGDITLLIRNNKYKYQTGDGGYVSYLYKKYYKLGFLPWSEYHRIKEMSKGFTRIDQPDETNRIQKKLF